MQSLLCVYTYLLSLYKDPASPCDKEERASARAGADENSVLHSHFHPTFKMMASTNVYTLSQINIHPPL